MKIILLPRGFHTLVDNEDYEVLSQFRWHASESGRRVYARRSTWTGLKTKMILLHRDLLKPPAGVDVDHINGNGLDNRRSNLRIVTRSQNVQAFQLKRKNLTSRYRGVSWHAQRQKWRAVIHIFGRQKSLGMFVTQKEAAQAYDLAAKRLFREFAQPNLKQ